MKTRFIAACGLLLATRLPASAHRLDEYLQATTISVEYNRIQAQMHLTPGVAVFPAVFAGIDTDGDKLLSAAEQHAYAERVRSDLSLAIDGSPLQLRLIAWKFANTAEMKAGRGDIQLEFQADVPSSSRSRKLVFENHHRERIAVYLVNCLVPRDPNIQVTAQKRNYLQSHYELDYVQAGTLPNSGPSAPVRQPGTVAWLCAAALLGFVPLAWRWQHARVRRDTDTLKSDVSTHPTASPPEGRSV